MGIKEDLAAMNELDPKNVLGAMNLSNANQTAGSRGQMFTSYLEQYAVPNHPEVPLMFTGMEKCIGLYNDSLNISKSRREILHRQEKYPNNAGWHYSLITREVETGIISLTEHRHYENLSEEHGYIKQNLPVDYKQAGNFIEMGEVTSKAPSHDEYNNLRYGFNANTAYMSHECNIEDGIGISESLRDKITFSTIKSFDVILGYNSVLLNLMGKDGNYKAFPDILESVEGGVFAVRRDVTNASFATDMTSRSLKTLGLNDIMYQGNGESQVIDIEVYVNNVSEMDKNNKHRAQLKYYYDLNVAYARGIVDNLKKYINSPKYRLTDISGIKYYQYKTYVDVADNPDDSKVKYATNNNGGVFEFCKVKVTVANLNAHLNIGGKISNRYGGKGVVCQVLPDNLMPKDIYGNSVDVLLNPLGVFNRSNPAQLYEHELLFIASIIANRMSKETTLPNKYKLFISFIERVDKLLAKTFIKEYQQLNITGRRAKMFEIESKGIYLRQDSFHNITFEELKLIYRDFGIFPDKLSFNLLCPDGVIRKKKTVNDVIIAKEYFMILRHTTDNKFSAVSISKLNINGQPGKNTAESKTAAYRTTPIKFGNMEVFTALNRMSPGIINRHLAGAGFNLAHKKAVADNLISKNPLRYHDVDIKTEDIENNVATDATVAILHQMAYVVYEDSVSKTFEVGRPPNWK